MRMRTFLALAASAAALLARAGYGAETDEFSSDYEADYRLDTTVAITSHEDGLASRDIGVRYYLQTIEDLGQPYRLHPYFQRASYAELGYTTSDADDRLWSIAGRYFPPDWLVGFRLGFDFGETAAGDLFSIRGGVDLNVAEEKGFAAEASFVSEKVDADPAIETTGWSIGGRYVWLNATTGGAIEVAAGYAGSTEPGTTSTGFVVEGRYFFDAVVFAGLKFDASAGVNSLCGGFWSGDGFQAEVEWAVWSEHGGFIRVMAGMRF